jgi:hypothetical protein
MQNFYKVDLVSLQVVNVSNLNEINKKYLKYLLHLQNSVRTCNNLIKIILCISLELKIVALFIKFLRLEIEEKSKHQKM